MTPSFSIQPATAGDADLLVELGARLFEETFAADNDPADMRAYLAEAFTPAKIAAELADRDRRVWIARDDAGNAVGYAMVREHPAPDAVRATKALELVRIYADQRFHGHGLGSGLTECCLDHARTLGCDAIWLGVWEHNPRAIAFYRRFGFREVGSQTFQLGRDVQRDLVLARAP